MSTPLIRRPEPTNGSAVASAKSEYSLPATVADLGAQVSAVLALLTGIWVALSPWFITLQQSGTNANTINLISGLAVAGLGAFALISPHGWAGLEVGGLLLGVWLIIAGPILSQKHAIADPMYWSNSWAGGVLIALAAMALLGVAVRRPARR